jgi:quercetin dioxygenase-like cupin family protein
MYIIDEKDEEYRFGDHGPKYLMKGPRMNFAVVQFMPGQDFRAHYHEVMEENFYILEGRVTIVVDKAQYSLTKGQFIHIEPHEVHYLINTSSDPVRLVATLAPFKDGDKIEVDNPPVKSE